MSVQPFKIDVAQDVLDDLQKRLKRTRWPDQVEGAEWSYGTNLDYMKDLIGYWQNGFDWRKQEAELNRFAHFTAEIDGLNIHFIHQRGMGPNPTPLLLLHGWPDSFYRYSKLIPMLTDPASYGGDAADSFDVIVPSLPGFGFSDRPTQRGGADMVGILIKLMTDVLGYERFGVHGGDTGSPLTKQIAQQRPDLVSAIHLSDIGYDVVYALDRSSLSEAEQKYVQAYEQWSYAEGAYVMIHGTKPQSLAYALTDSPAGLAGWIIEHFQKWSDNTGNPDQSFSKDELLTNLMIYWATETINSSMRLYYEGMNASWDDSGNGEWGEESSSGNTDWSTGGEEASAETGAESGEWGRSEGDSSGWGAPVDPSTGVPAGVALFPRDIPLDNPPPRELGERLLNIKRWTVMSRGGHFAALEAPDLLTEDIRAFFRDYRG